jgi:hypothetical protein
MSVVANVSFTRPYLRYLCLFLGVLSLGLAPSLSAAEAVLSRDGKALFDILVPEGAIPAERTAAAQLQKYLNLVTGAEFSIKPVTEEALKSPHIQIGPRAEELSTPEFQSLGKDGILIEVSPERILLSGGRPRGTLYAVFQFLEDAVGCRWWTPRESFIPKKTTLTAASQELRYVPKFSYREHFTTSTRYHPEFATTLRENGHHQKQEEDWGGHYELIGFSHTFSELLPPERYFRDHPEWYTDAARGSLPSTKDTPMPEAQRTQLCLTNPEVLDELTKNALQWISKHPDAGYISITQNDYTAFCQCANCQKIAEREDSQSGPILEFVNAVAERIGKVYPDFLVETMAYTYSEKAPKTVRPASNVVIRLALAMADFGHPMNSEWNDPARKLLLSWADISPHLFIWSYATNFKKAMFPHPNWSSLAEDLQFFAAHNVQGVFAQGDCYTGDVGDFPQLRAWLMGKLLWNPDQDQKALTTEFLNGYYGAAGPFLQQYLELVTKAFDRQKRGLNTNNQDFSFLTLDVVTQGEGLFAKARAAVADEPQLLDRVRREQLSLTIGRIARDRALRSEAESIGVSYPSPEEVDRQLTEFAETAKSFGLLLWGENISLEQGVADLRRVAAVRQVKLPEFAQKLSADRVIDFQPSMLTLAFPEVLTEVREDPASSGGKVVAMKTGSKAWLVQAQLGPYLNTSGDNWRIYAVVRAEENGRPKSGNTAFEGGVFDDSDMKHVGRFVVNFGKLSRDRFATVDLGSYRLTPGMSVWFAPHSTEDAREIIFDRMLLVREEVR